MSGFQIHHREFGVYQGSCMGLGFWHPMSNMPEQGFCRFETIEEANKYIIFLCSPECDMPLKEADLSVEPFDHEESNRLETSQRR